MTNCERTADTETRPVRVLENETAMSSVPVLCYHSLDETGSVISTAPGVFRVQMRALSDWGYQGIRLSDLLDGWEGKSQLPPRPVVLTFDDGFRNVLDHAVPVLTELGFRATVFVVAGHCGGMNDWPTDPASIPRLPLLSWSDLSAMARDGFEVGAHGMTHAPLPRLSAEDAEREIAGSQRIMEQELGRPVTTFAYPYGMASPANRALANSCYRAACGVRLGWARRSDDPFRLRRIEMYYLRNQTFFRLFPTSLGRTYVGLRAIGRTCRYALQAIGCVAGPATE